MSRLFRKALLALSLTPVLAALFFAASLAAFAVPNGPILENLRDRPDVLLARRADNGRVIDADTECIGLSVGLDIEGVRPPLVERAVRAQSLYGCDPLSNFLNGAHDEVILNYYRYWHGQLLISRPLLALMPYNDLRGLLFHASIALLALFAWRVGNTFGAPTAFALIAPFIVLNAMGYFVVATKAVTWFLALGAALCMFGRKQRETPLVWFFALGALTAYFDFFTAPAFIFCLAMLALAFARARDGGAATSGEFIAAGVFWSAGWAGFILIKIALAAALVGPEAWSNFVTAAAFRVRGESDHVDSYFPGAALFANLAAMKSFWAPVAVIAFLVLPFATKARRARWAELFRARSVLLLVAGAPLLWIEVFTNHTQIHAAFTQINYAPLFILAGLVLAGSPALGRMGS